MRFQSVIYDESRRLSDAAQDLVSYFDQAQETTRLGSSAHEIFESFLAKHNHVFPQLEETTDPESVVGEILQTELSNAPQEAVKKAQERLITYSQDAQKMPLKPFVEAARKNAFSPDILASQFSMDLHAVFRRLASLRRDGVEAPSFGLVVINAAGQPLFRRPLESFSLPRFSSICALWPAFQALSTPGLPISEIIVLPNGREFLARALAQPSGPAQFGQTPAILSAMLVTSLNDAHQFGMLDPKMRQSSRNVGTSCRLCLQTACPARSEPSILPASD